MDTHRIEVIEVTTANDISVVVSGLSSVNADMSGISERETLAYRCAIRPPKHS